MKKVICMVSLLLLLFISGCTQAQQVSDAVSKEADAFNIVRRLTVVNLRTDTLICEMYGKFSTQHDTKNNDLDIICKIGEDTYRKHYIHISDGTIYVIEDVTGEKADSYHYEFHFFPMNKTSYTEK